MKPIITTAAVVFTVLVLALNPTVFAASALLNKIDITAEPESAEGYIGDMLTFSLSASSTSGSSLYYIWYYGSEKVSDGTILEAVELNSTAGDFYVVNGSSLTVTVTGDMYVSDKRCYVYCIITDIDSNVARSEKAYINVIDTNEYSFDIAYSPAGAIDAFIGGEALVSVSASIPETKLGVLSYQWYSASSADLAGSEPLQGENKPYIMIPTTEAGLSYYYCKVSNVINGKTYTSYYGESNQSVKAVVRVNPATITTVMPFNDVKSGEWYYSDLLYAYRSGIINGKSTNKFGPDGTVTVAEAVKIAGCINQLMNKGVMSLTNGTPWYSTYMEYALSNGIINADLSSSADEAVSRERLIGILYKSLSSDRFSQINTVRDGSVSDVGKENPYSDAVYAFYRAGILEGYGDGSFRPSDKITRAELAVIVTRIINISARVVVK